MIPSVRKKNVGRALSYREVFLPRPLSFRELEMLVKKAKVLRMAPSTFERLGKKSKELLKAKRIGVIIERRSGRPIGIKPDLLVKAMEMYKAGISLRKIQRQLGIAKSTIHYIARYSKKNRIKKENMTIFLD